MINYGTKKDGDPTAAGAVTDAEFNSFLSELKGAIQPFMTLSGQETDQLIRSIDIATKAIYYQDVGAVNALQLERPLIGAKIGTLQDGMTFLFKPKNTNTGPSTMKVENLEVKNIKFKGNDLSAGDLQFSILYIAIYNASNNAFDIDVVGAGIGISKLEKMLVLANNEVQNLYGTAVNTLSKWAVGKVYEQGRVEFYNGLRYIATAPSTATTANAPDQANAPWINYSLLLRHPFGHVVQSYDYVDPNSLPYWLIVANGQTLAVDQNTKIIEYLNSLGRIKNKADYDAGFSADFWAVQGNDLYVPNASGLFYRNSGGLADSVGKRQLDKGRNIKGSAFVRSSLFNGNHFALGAFYTIYSGEVAGATTNLSSGTDNQLGIDASRSYGTDHTGDEFNPINTAGLPLINTKIEV